MHGIRYLPALTALADDLLQLAENDPGACIARCRDIISSGGGGEDVAAAHRASGVALRSLGRIDESIEALRLAEVSYRALGHDGPADEALISLAPSLAISGEFGAAVDILDPICESGDPLVRAHAQAQLAGLVARTGEFERALALYGEALPTLEEHHDNRGLALLFATRGLVQTYRSEFAEAETDIRAAMTLFETMGRESSVAEMLGNLGFMYVLSGEVAKGLATLVEAEQEFQMAGLPSEAISTARAYGYMLAGLPNRAHHVLMLAADSLHRQGRELEETEARILAGRAALEDGDSAGAIAAIDAALQLASTSERTGWVALATLMRARAVSEEGGGSVAELRDLADRLRRIDNVSAAVDACVLAAGAALDQGDLTQAGELIGNALTTGTHDLELPVVVRRGLVQARLGLAIGQDDDALAVLIDVADRIDRSRLLLSATESRAGLSRHSDRVAALGLSVIEEPSEAVEWVERFRGSSLRIAPVVPNSNAEVARLLSDLRRAVKARDDLALAGESLESAIAEIRSIEAAIRDRVIANPELSAYRPPATIADIRAALGEDQLLYLFEREDELLVAQFVSGEVEIKTVGDMNRIAMVSHHLLSSMRRAFLYPARADPTRTHDMLAELASLFFGTSPIDDGNFVVVPPPDLLALPWNALLSKVAPESALVVAPSAASWVRAKEVELGGRDTVVVAGPRLAQAGTEASAIRAVHGEKTTVLEGGAATIDAALDAIDRCSIFHAVAHGNLRKDSPMFSALELVDGEMNLYHLERLAHTPPIVVLSACDSAHGSVVAGQELFGLTSVFLERGTRSILSTVAPIPDSAAAVGAIREIHIGLRDGVDMPSALSGALAGSASDAVDPVLAFVVYGAF